MDEDLLLSDLSVALGQLYLSVGVDLIPSDIMYKPLPEAIDILQKQLAHTDNFASYIDETYHTLFSRMPHRVVKATPCKINMATKNTKPTLCQSKSVPGLPNNRCFKKT